MAKVRPESLGTFCPATRAADLGSSAYSPFVRRTATEVVESSTLRTTRDVFATPQRRRLACRTRLRLPNGLLQPLASPSAPLKGTKARVPVEMGRTHGQDRGLILLAANQLHARARLDSLVLALLYSSTLSLRHGAVPSC